MGKPFSRKPITDADALKHASRLAELASPHMDEALTTVLEVMRDPKSRQRLTAAGMIVDWSTRAESDAAAAEGGGEHGVRILVVQSNDMDAIQRRLMAENA